MEASAKSVNDGQCAKTSFADVIVPVVVPVVVPLFVVDVAVYCCGFLRLKIMFFLLLLMS